MRVFDKIKRALTQPRYILIYILYIIAPIVPDRLYLRLMFRLKMGYWMDFDNPQTFNEKLQWLKLYNRRPEYTQMVDKYAVKEYVASIIGEQYIIPTLGVWDSVEDIDFDSLPNKFVLKTTHGGGGGGVIICQDKSNFDIGQCKTKLQQSLDSCIYRNLREWPYKDVPHRIIAEQYIENQNGQLNDYKFYCFNGVAKSVMICLDRDKGDTKFYFFSPDWELLRLNQRGVDAPENFTLPKPENIDKMFGIAERLCGTEPFLRVDLYNVNGQIFFGELTFYPASGLDGNYLETTEKLFGDYINLEARV